MARKTRKRSNSAPLTLKAALQHLEQGRTERAERELSRLTGQDRQGEVWRALTIARERLEMPSALEAAHRAAERGGTEDDLKRLFRIGRANDDSQAMIAAADRLAELDPESSTWANARVLARLRLGELESALEVARGNVERRPDGPSSLRLQAGALRGMTGDREGAVAECREALADRGFQTREGDDGKPHVLILKAMSRTPPRINRQSGQITFETGNDLSTHVARAGYPTSDVYAEALQDRPELMDQAPPADVVLCSITDADKSPDDLATAQQLVERLGLPVVNHPSRILQTRRDANARRFANTPGVRFPRTVAIPVQGVSDPVMAVEEAMEANGIRYPVILRSAGLQTGRWMYRIENRRELRRMQVTDRVRELYLIEWLDTRDPATGLFRKFRAFLIGDELHMSHMYMSEDWSVHGGSAEELMRERADLRNRSILFLEDPLNELSSEILGSVKNALELTGLDYCGVDFAIDPEGQVVIFEANPAMQIVRPREGLEFQEEHARAGIDKALELISKKAVMRESS
ncbi:hypothetical protein [Thioalkalivibrio sp. AKL17]|uniref:hypothetical protein n=1 Tax=Thioalkalivibrio sp. AKL17 TaxID=1158160 RepID=UPI000377482F|nr:hypothetical protein [Thioalkalivibrio sp. AKL17]